MLTYEKGNIVTGNYTIFCHQVNCRSKMGAGLAKQIKSKYPEVYSEYCKECVSHSSNLLGKILPVFTTDGRICINMFSQDGYGRNQCFTQYSAFRSCLNQIAKFLSEHHVKQNVVIAFPYLIGCGLAGGDWNTIHKLIKEFSEKVSQRVVIVSLV